MCGRLCWSHFSKGRQSMDKIIGGKHEYYVRIDEQYGLVQTLESGSDIAFIEYVQERRAHHTNFTLTSEHRQLLNSVDPNWRTALEQKDTRSTRTAWAFMGLTVK